MIQQKFDALVGVFRAAVAGQLPPGKRPAPVHVGMHPPGKRLLAGVAQITAIIEVRVT